MAREAINLGQPVKHGKGVRWTRMVGGERWVSKTYPHETRENKREAWREFVHWREERLARPTPLPQDNLTLIRQAVTQKVQALLDHAELTANPTEAAVWRDLLPDIPAMDRDNLFRLTALVAGEYRGKDHTTVIEDREKSAARMKQATASDLTARHLADEYTRRLLRKAESGRMSYGNYGQAKSALDLFVAFFGAVRSLEHLSEKAVRDYTEHLEQRIAAEDLSRNTAHRYQQQFRTWIDYLVENYPDDIPRPKNLRSKSQLIPKQRKEPDPFTVEEVTLLLKHAVPRTRLFLLLMLNCGMYQGDIADLTPAEIDWQAGRVVRARSKTKRQAETNGATQPVKVNWLLWRTTWELFQQFAHRDGFCFRTEGGGRLVTQKTSTRNDAVRSAYSRLVAKLKRKRLLPEKWNKTLKVLRKTGANLLEKAENPIYAQYYNLYLSSSVAKQSYLTSGEPVPSFDLAVGWLGKQMGIN
jgi:integrase